MVTRHTTPSPQRTRPQLTIDDVRIYTTPPKLMRSLQNSAYTSSGGLEQQHSQILASPCSGKVEWNPTVALNGDGHNLKSEVAAKRNDEKVRFLGKHNGTLNEELVPDGTESVSSTGDVSACKVCREDCEDDFKAPVKTKERVKYGIAVMGFIWSLFLILVVVIVSAVRTDNDELFFEVVPT